MKENDSNIEWYIWYKQGADRERDSNKWRTAGRAMEGDYNLNNGLAVSCVLREGNIEGLAEFEVKGLE